MILDKARELGMALSESEEFCRVIAAREAVDAHEGVRALLDEYQDAQNKMVEILSGEDMDKTEVAALTKHTQEIEGMLLDNPLFSELLDAQTEFQKLMQQVNREIGACIGMESADPDEDSIGCTGSCATCGGCH